MLGNQSSELVRDSSCRRDRTVGNRLPERGPSGKRCFWKVEERRQPGDAHDVEVTFSGVWYRSDQSLLMRSLTVEGWSGISGVQRF